MKKYLRVRICTAPDAKGQGSFQDLWQETEDGQEPIYVNDKGDAVLPPAKREEMVLDNDYRIHHDLGAKHLRQHEFDEKMAARVREQAATAQPAAPAPVAAPADPPKPGK